ncbi:MAG: S1 RNA-binding domain-containing protein [Clostridiales bacterium]|nr:S1 RNA-binding domain-containing protein [Clostridiales bacterium]
MKRKADFMSYAENTKYLPEGRIMRSAENRASISSISGLERAMRTGAICEAPAVMCDSRDYSLRVDLGCAVGLIERGEAALTGAGEEIREVAVVTRVGRPVCFCVRDIDISTNPPTVILSRRDAQRKCFHNYLSGLIPGDIIPATMTHIERFGAFLDIGCGIVSLLPVDAISVSRISHPSERLSVGTRTYVVISGIDAKNGRFNVSQRELFGTWKENAALFAVGQTVSGIVRSIEDYGIFVELTPNLTGLSDPKSGVGVGETAAVYIKSITPERMKIKLALVGAYRGELLRDLSPPTYFIDPERTLHIDRWRYSPDGCRRVVESVFTAARSSAD